MGVCPCVCVCVRIRVCVSAGPGVSPEPARGGEGILACAHATRVPGGVYVTGWLSGCVAAAMAAAAAVAVRV